jgi:hypothetical protein
MVWHLILGAMTPKNAANLANSVSVGLSREDDERVQDFISSESPRNLQQFAHLLFGPGEARYFPLAKIALEIRLAEDAANTADKLSQQTDRLVDETVKLTRFTKGLLWLTIAIAFFAFVQIVIMVFEYSSKIH